MPLVAARCPQCGGEIQLDNQKENGFCMHCGSKIIVQEAIKIVRIDNTQNITNWIKMGKMAKESGNDDEAYSYYTRVLEIQPDNWEILYERGKIAGWKSTLSKPRLQEAAIAFGNAVRLAPEEEKEEILKKSSKELIKMIKEYLTLQLDKFRMFPGDEEKNAVINSLELAKNVTEKYAEISEYKISGYLESIAKLICSNVYSTYSSKIITDYGGYGGHPDDNQFNQFIKRIDACTNLINHAIELSENEDENILRYEQLIKLEEIALNSCSYEYVYTNIGRKWQTKNKLEPGNYHFRQISIQTYKNKISALKAK